MANEGKGIALVILGIVAVIAIVGLVLLFSQAKSTGQAGLGISRYPPPERIYTGQYGDYSGQNVPYGADEINRRYGGPSAEEVPYQGPVTVLYG